MVVVSVVVDVLVSGVAVAIGVAVSIGVAVTVAVVSVLVVVLVVVSVEVAGDGFTIVVLFSVFSAGEAVGFATVVSFCSQAARSAAPARMQMYFFIIFWFERPYWAKG